MRRVLGPRSSVLGLILLACSSTTTTLDHRAPELMASAKVPGMQVAIVDGGKVTARAYGVANVNTGEKVTSDTVFEAASISKPVFAYALMKMAAAGQIDLDKSLASYLPEPYTPDPRVAKITARMVLTHRSGFPNWRPQGKDLELRFDPGTSFGYSGEGVVYLQRVVEAITKEPFDTFMHRMVFAPLGMTSSSYIWLPSYDERKSWGHDKEGKVFRRRKVEAPLAAATLHTTATDLGRFVSALLNDDYGRSMLQFQVATPSNCAVCATTTPGPPSTSFAWGLGIGLLDRRYAWHWGDDGDFKAYVFADTQTKRGAVVLTNAMQGLKIAGDVAAIVIGNDKPLEPLKWLEYR